MDPAYESLDYRKDFSTYIKQYELEDDKHSCKKEKNEKNEENKL